MRRFTRACALLSVTSPWQLAVLMSHLCCEPIRLPIILIDLLWFLSAGTWISVVDSRAEDLGLWNCIWWGHPICRPHVFCLRPLYVKLYSFLHSLTYFIKQTSDSCVNKIKFIVCLHGQCYKYPPGHNRPECWARSRNNCVTDYKPFFIFIVRYCYTTTGNIINHDCLFIIVLH